MAAVERTADSHLALPRSFAFVEDDEYYRIFNEIHVKHASIFVGALCIVLGVSGFSCGIVFFPWELYETAFDVIAIMGFLIFLLATFVVHIMLMYAVKTIKFRHTFPSLIFHSFLLAIEGVTALIAVGDLVADHVGTKDQAAHSTEAELYARNAVLFAPLLMIFHLLVIQLINRTRAYLRNKRRHIRNGLPPPIREVVREGVFAFRNKVFNGPESLPYGATVAPIGNQPTEPPRPATEDKDDSVV